MRVHVPKKTVTIAAWNRRRRVSSFIVLLPAATHAASQRSRLGYPARSLSRREVRVHTAGDTLLAREGDEGGDSGDVALGSIASLSRCPPNVRLAGNLGNASSVLKVSRSGDSSSETEGLSWRDSKEALRERLRRVF